MNGTSDPIAYGDGLKLKELVLELGKCAPLEGHGALQEADNSRFCRWPGQHPDGLKHSIGEDEAFPWERASDMRPFMVDQIINERAGTLIETFWRAMVRPKAGRTEESQYAVSLVDYLVNTVLPMELVREVELSAQYMEHHGWTMLHPYWERKLGKKRQKVELSQLVPIGVSLGFLDFGTALLDEAREDEVIPVLQKVYAAWVTQGVGKEFEIEVPQLKPRSIKKALSELRATGAASIAVPYIASNRPRIIALRPYDEVAVPRGTTDEREMRVVFQREWLSEAELVARVDEQGYNPQWVEKVKQRKGPNSFFWSLPSDKGQSSQLVGSIDGSPYKENDICIVHAIRRVVDEDGVPEIYLTTFHPLETVGPNNEEWCAKHEIVSYPHGEYPFVYMGREYWCRQLTASRGVPEIATTWQNQYKAIRDFSIDRVAITLMPPIIEQISPIGTSYRFGPAMRNPVLPGKEPKFMDLPQATGMQEGEIQLAEIRKEADNYFGMMAEDVPPARYQTQQAGMARKFLMGWSKALQQAIELCREYMPDQEFATATGAPPGWLDARRDRLGLFAANLAFDVRELDPEFMKALIEALGKAIETDATGAIDRAKATKLVVRSISPVWSSEIVMDQQSASQAMWEGVRNDIAQMFLGNEARYVENDPAAATKLQYAQQIIQQNPTYTQALQAGGRFAALFEKWSKNLNFSVTQDKNKLRGRIGV